MNNKVKQRKLKSVQKELAFWEKELDRVPYLNIDSEFKRRLADNFKKRIEEVEKKILTLK